jgi:PAS domain S-box-containing protein
MTQASPRRSERTIETGRQDLFSRTWPIAAAMIVMFVTAAAFLASLRTASGTRAEFLRELLSVSPVLCVLVLGVALTIRKFRRSNVQRDELLQDNAELLAKATRACESAEHFRRQLELANDVTQNAEAEAALRESRARLHSLVNQAPFGICRSGFLAERFETVNPALCEMLGYSEEEVLNLSLATQVYTDPRERLHFMELLRRTGRLQGHELILRRKDGSPIRLRVSAVLTSYGDEKEDHVEAYVET